VASCEPSRREELGLQVNRHQLLDDQYTTHVLARSDNISQPVTVDLLLFIHPPLILRRMSFSPVGLRRAAHNLRPRNGPPLTLPVYARQTQSLPLRASWHLRHRLYSDSSVEPVEPPEYLSEGEKKVFDLIKDGLRPTKLEVCFQVSPILGCPSNWFATGPRYLRRLRFHVRPRHCVRPIQRSTHH
jgi:hypothetical protein